MASDLELNLDPKVEQDFRELLTERGYASINDFIVDTLKDDRAVKRRAKLEDLSGRMWPGGAPNQSDES